MSSTKKTIKDRILFDSWLLIGLLVLLAACWWAMPLNVFPNLKLPVPAQLGNDPSAIPDYPTWSLGAKLGFWIASRGWDSGPPSEYAYDFIFFWHLALSALAYCLIFIRLQTKVRQVEKQFLRSDVLSVKSLLMLFFYPVITFLILMLPWDNREVMGHRMFSLMIYPPLFCSLSLIELGSPGRRTPHRFIRLACLPIAAFAFASPFYGGGIAILIFLGMSLAVTVWALVTFKVNVKTIQLSFQSLDH